MSSRSVVVLTSTALIVSGAAITFPAQAASTHTVNTVPYVQPNGERGAADLTGVGKAARVPGNDSPIVVSLGDSYISGEAGRWAGNVLLQGAYWRADALGTKAYNDVPGAEAIDGCHRAQRAEVHFRSPGVTSVNLACSGATTGSSYSARHKQWKPGIDFATQSLPGPATGYGQAKMLQNLAAANPDRISAVILSIGGNDFDFGPIVGACVQNFIKGEKPCSSDATITGKVAEPNVSVQRKNVADAVNRVIEAVGDNGGKDWTLLVQDYPSPVATSATIRYKRQSYERWASGGCPMYDADLDWANDRALRVIDDTVRAAVEDATKANPRARIRFLELKDALVGHRLCEQNVYPLDSVEQPIMNWEIAGAVDTSEWVQSVRALGQVTREWTIWPFKTQESLHPNYWAQLAYQTCLTQAYGNGTSVRGGTCVYAGTGLDASKRPRMSLLQEGWQQQLPGDFGTRPGRVRAVRTVQQREKLARVSWRPPSGSAKHLGYAYRLRAPKSEWTSWLPLGTSKSVAVVMPRKGRYAIKIVAQVRGRTGTPVVATFVRG